jgi:hypothetical protein
LHRQRSSRIDLTAELGKSGIMRLISCSGLSASKRKGPVVFSRGMIDGEPNPVKTGMLDE